MADHLNNKPYGAWIAIDIAKDFNAVLSETKEGKRQHSTCRIVVSRSNLSHACDCEIINKEYCYG